MQQKKVCYFNQPEQRIFIRVGDRLIAGIAAGHYPNISGIKQQIMQRRIGQHHANSRISRRHASRQVIAASFIKQQNRSHRAGQQFLFGG